MRFSDKRFHHSFPIFSFVYYSNKLFITLIANIKFSPFRCFITTFPSPNSTKFFNLKMLIGFIVSAYITNTFIYWFHLLSIKENFYITHSPTLILFSHLMYSLSHLLYLFARAINELPQVIRSASSSLLGIKTITSQPSFTRGCSNFS